MSDTSPSMGEPVVLQPGEGRPFPNPLPEVGMDFPGLLKLSGRRTDRAFMVAEMCEPPGKGPPPHIHDDFSECFYILDGTWEFRVGDETISAEAGAFLFVPRGVVHAYRNVGSTPARYLGIVAPPPTDLYAQTRLAP